MLASVALIGVGIAACAESKLDSGIKQAQTEATAREAAAAEALAKQADLAKRLDAAEKSATGADGVVDPAKEYAALVAGAPTPAEKGAIAGAVASGKTPGQAGADLVAAAAADAKTYADQAKAARDAAAQLESQRAAAKQADTTSWLSGVQNAGAIANLFWPGVGLLVGGVGTLVVQKARGATFTDGQADGATQVAQGIATLRKLSPAVDTALNTVGPLVKKIVADTMDAPVADAVAANRDVPADGTHALLATPGAAVLAATTA
jgi:hypothetical protein